MHMLIIPGLHGGDGGINVVDDRPLQILRLESFAGPAAGRSTVVTERAAYPIVGSHSPQQCVNLLHGGLGAAEPQLQRSTNGRGQILFLQQPLDCCAVQCLCWKASLL